LPVPEFWSIYSSQSLGDEQQYQLSQVIGIHFVYVRFCVSKLLWLISTPKMKKASSDEERKPPNAKSDFWDHIRCPNAHKFTCFSFSPWISLSSQDFWPYIQEQQHQVAPEQISGLLQLLRVTLLQEIHLTNWRLAFLLLARAQLPKEEDWTASSQLAVG